MNTSSLLILGGLGRLVLPHHEGWEVYIPRTVAEEIAEKRATAAQAVQTCCAILTQVRDVRTKRL